MQQYTLYRRIFFMEGALRGAFGRFGHTLGKFNNLSIILQISITENLNIAMPYGEELESRSAKYAMGAYAGHRLYIAFVCPPGRPFAGRGPKEFSRWGSYATSSKEGRKGRKWQGGGEGEWQEIGDKGKRGSKCIDVWPCSPIDFHV